MNKLLFWVIAFSCFAAGCKKNISLRGQNDRLVGEWKLDQISSSGTGVNGQSSAGATTEFYKPTVLKLNIDQTASLDGYLLRKDVDTTTFRHVSGSWVATATKLTLNWDGDDVYLPEVQEYDLKFLSKKEMKISFQRVNSGGSGTGLVSDFTFVYKFTK